jgi:hypothetical protein
MPPQEDCLYKFLQIQTCTHTSVRKHTHIIYTHTHTHTHHTQKPTYTHTQQHTRCTPFLQSALRLAPRFTDAYNNLAGALASRGDVSGVCSCVCLWSVCVVCVYVCVCLHVCVCSVCVGWKGNGVWGCI